jgi:ankyrin repeat protein
MSSTNPTTGIQGESKAENLDLQDKLLHLSLLNALTENDLAGTLDVISKIISQNFRRLSYGSPLHLVITLSDFKSVGKVISAFCKPNSPLATASTLGWVNVQNDDLETPLHIASQMGKVNVLDLLFDLPMIDDTKRQNVGKTAQELAKDDLTAEFFASIIELSIGQVDEFIFSTVRAMKNAANLGDHTAMEKLFEENQRAKSYLKQGWIDINGSIGPNGDSVLHLAAFKNNIELVCWALKYGADPDVKNSKDKKPIDLAKSDPIRNMLKHTRSQTPILATSLAQATSSDGHNQKEAPSIRGWLQKWTNYKDNYRQR